MRFSLRETKIELFTKCHFLTSDKVFALHDVRPLRVNLAFYSNSKAIFGKLSFSEKQIFFRTLTKGPRLILRSFLESSRCQEKKCL